MKAKYSIVLMVFAAITFAGLATKAAEADYVVHEWGTFTSFQGDDGKLIYWHPLRTAQLPPFVYNWMRPGIKRTSTRMELGGGKGSLVTLQRLETPVVYFYSDAAMAVDVTVKFPKGYVTEWYPLAGDIGPSAPLLLTPAADRAVVNGPEAVNRESFIKWSGLQIMPAAENSEILKHLSVSVTGSHYFAARETAADLVRANISNATNKAPQYEKFLFYRGAGNFETPLHVTMPADGTVVVANTGKETLSHLFVLGIKDKAGKFIYVDELKAGEEKSIPLDLQKDVLPGAELTKKISEAMTDALQKSSLYPQEASAMVKTWSDSWFAEDGVRVLYTLPRAWTDQTLPMTLNPTPKQVIRVMVGRAEVLPPEIERSLAEEVGKAKSGDAEASAETRKILKSLGRFAEPAFYRVLAGLKPLPAEQGKLMVLLNESQGEVTAQ